MKKILLAAINARYTHSCLALYCLKSALRGLDVSAIIREFSINQKIEEIAAMVAAEEADVIALSVYIWNSELTRMLIPELKRRCGTAILLLGGPEVSYNPESWLTDYPFIDHIVTGNGEEAFRQLVKNGLGTVEKIVGIPNPPFAGMPSPYSEEDLAGLRNRYIYYESSRGCPFHCTYCLSARSDQKMELKDPETVKEELKTILRSGPLLVKFVDRTFNAARDHCRAIWNFLLEYYGDGPTAFHFEIHPLRLGDDDFDLLSRCPKGLFQFEIGVQTTNPETLSAVKRTGAWDREKAALERLIGLGTIRIHLDLIAGLPFDDMASVARSYNELYDLRPDHLQLGFLKILPGTEMMDAAGQYGMVYSKKAPYQVIENRWLGTKDLRLLEQVALLTDRLYNTHRFDTTLSLLAGRHGSSFDLYRELASTQVDTVSRITRSWESGALFLFDYISSRFPGEKIFFLDAMRWDWCSVSRSPHYPDMIRPEGISGTKKKSIAFFGSHGENGMVHYRDSLFSLSDLKRSLFFKPESDEFRRHRMKDDSFALFLPGHRIILYSM